MVKDSAPEGADGAHVDLTRHRGGDERGPQLLETIDCVADPLDESRKLGGVSLNDFNDALLFLRRRTRHSQLENHLLGDVLHRGACASGLPFKLETRQRRAERMNQEARKNQL